MDVQRIQRFAMRENFYRFFGDLYSKRPDLNILQEAVSLPVRYDLPDDAKWRKYTSYAAQLRKNNTTGFEKHLPKLIIFYDTVMGDNLLELYEYGFYTRKNDYACATGELEEFFVDYPYRKRNGLDTGHIALQLYYLADLSAISQEQAYSGNIAAVKEGIMVQQMFYKRFTAVWWPFFAYEIGRIAEKYDFYRETAALFKCFMADDTQFMQYTISGSDC